MSKVWVALIAMLALAFALALKPRDHPDKVPASMADASASRLEQELASEPLIGSPSALRASPLPSLSPAPDSDPQQTIDAIEQGFEEARPIFRQKAAIARSPASELHGTPKPMLEAARELGEVVALAEDHPEHADRFREFYEECARDEEVITVIRSQCLDHYLKLAGLDPEQREALLGTYPPAIVRLYRALQ